MSLSIVLKFFGFGFEREDMTDAFDAELTTKLENHFPEDKAVISDIVDQVQEARQYEYTDCLGLE